MTAILEKIKELARGKRAAVLTGYAEYVAAVAGGTKVDPASVADAIDRAGKSPDEFEADVAAQAERLRLRAVADKRPEAQRTLDATKAKIGLLERKLEEAVAAIRDEAAPLHETVARCEATIRSAVSAEDELLRSYPADGAARTDLATARKRGESAERRAAELREMVKRANGVVALSERPGVHASNVEEGKLAKVRAGQYEGELRDVLAERDRAVADQEAAVGRMTQP